VHYNPPLNYLIQKKLLSYFQRHFPLSKKAIGANYVVYSRLNSKDDLQKFNTVLSFLFLLNMSKDRDEPSLSKNESNIEIDMGKDDDNFPVVYEDMKQLDDINAEHKSNINFISDILIKCNAPKPHLDRGLKHNLLTHASGDGTVVYELVKDDIKNVSDKKLDLVHSSLIIPMYGYFKNTVNKTIPSLAKNPDFFKEHKDLVQNGQSILINGVQTRNPTVHSSPETCTSRPVCTQSTLQPFFEGLQKLETTNPLLLDLKKIEIPKVLEIESSRKVLSTLLQYEKVSRLWGTPEGK
jgi:hypothetical protein